MRILLQFAVRGAVLLALLAACERGSAAPPTDPGNTSAPAIVLTSGTSNVVAPREWNSLITISVGRRADFVNPITLTVEGLPAGVTGAFALSTVPSNVSSTKLNLETASTAAFGTYPVVIRATSGAESATTTVSVNVPRPSFQLSATSAVSTTIGAALPGVATLTVVRDYFYRGTLTFAFSDVPSGVIVGTNFRIAPDESAASIAFRAGATAIPGSYLLTVRATGPDVDERVATVQLTIAR
jgi:hypothetical protein